MTVISIEPFDAMYPVRKMGGKTAWYHCRIFGLLHEGALDEGRFVVVTKTEDGDLYTTSLPSVRRVDE